MKKLFLSISILFFAYAQEPIIALPQYISYNRELAELGLELFVDPSLSKDKRVSCHSCHQFSHGGADNLPFSQGSNQQKGGMNAPSVFNALFNFKQFWNGRANDLVAQASGPMQNPLEMGMNKEAIVNTVKNNPHYVERFNKIFKTRTITLELITQAIAEFEKTLVTPNAKFDRFLHGELSLAPQELKGYQKFKEYGCASCHNGMNLGGNSYEKFGIVYSYPWNQSIDDRYKLTGLDIDKNVFKVPSLRNIALTEPYFHDGHSRTLKDAIKDMGYYNLGMQLSQADIEDIEAFLKTLTGEKPIFLQQMGF